MVFGGAQVGTTKYLKIIKADDKMLAKAYGLSDGIVLVHPDGYIALIASEPGDVHKY